MARWNRFLYSAMMLVLTALYFLLPSQPRFLWTLIGLGSLAAMVAGILVNRPQKRLPWLLVTAGVASLIAGDTTYDLLTDVFGYDNPFPSVADGIYLGMYPLIAVGLLLMIRAREVANDRHAMIDALILTTGLGLLAWVFWVEPYLQDTSLGWLEKGVSIAYPLGDVLVLAVLARLLISSGPHPRSLRLLTAGSVGLLVADVLYGLIQLRGGWHTGGPVDLGWIVFYAAWGLASLEPDMVRLAAPGRSAPHLMSRPRLLMLGSASLVAPGLLLWEAATGNYRDVGVVAGVAAGVFVLVCVRLSGLIEVARQSMQRENILRRTSESLVAAPSRDEVYAVGARAVRQISEFGADPRVLVASRHGNAYRLEYDSGPTENTNEGLAADSSIGMNLGDLVARHGDTLRDHHFVLTESHLCGDLLHARLGTGVPVILAAMLREGDVSGVLVAAGGEVGRTEIIDAVCAMASQMMLALESAELAEQMLQRKNDIRFRSLIQNASDIILVVDTELRLTFHTPSAQAVLGRTNDQLVGQPIDSLVIAQDAGRARTLLRRCVGGNGPDHQPGVPDDEWHLADDSGRTRAFEVTCRNLTDDPSVRGLVLTLHDITDRRELENELKHLAFHDSLTQLPNRSLFMDRVEHALARRGRHRERLAVMLIDLDDFKLVNDSRGHSAGDDLLMQVAQRLTDVIRPEDTCARLGGDEFAVLVEGLLDDDEALQLGERIVSQLRLPYRIEDEDRVVGASLGISTSDYGLNANELFRQADLALYAAKDAGKSTHELYRPSLQDVMHERLRLTRDLELAIERDEFVVHYQPIVHLATGRVTATEALVRWQHPNRGLLFPGDFIDAVEESDLVIPLGRQVLEQAVAQAATWQWYAAPGEALRVSVNVAPRQLRDPEFVNVVLDALHRHGLPPAALILEITERTLAGQDPQIVAAMVRLQSIGVRLAVDDFGTGYSALNYLRRFPVSILKIDRTFVAGLAHSGDDRALVEAIIRLGETFGLDLVAEGVETNLQRDALVELGCSQGQGFLFSRGLSPEKTEMYIAAKAASGSHSDSALHPIEPHIEQGAMTA
jgi:diguanylate cyclase (GGDEF)-like protein/PAS domain S-box-containing protein